MPVEVRLRLSTRGATVSIETSPDRRVWPHDLRPGALRCTRSSSNYDQTVAFYRDVLGLPVVGEFADSFGEDGTIFGLPDTHAQREIVPTRGGVTAADPLDMLVSYLPRAAAVATAPASATVNPRGWGVTARNAEGPGVVSFQGSDGPRDTEPLGEMDGQEPLPYIHPLPRLRLPGSPPGGPGGLAPVRARACAHAPRAFNAQPGALIKNGGPTFVGYSLIPPSPACRRSEVPIRPLGMRR
jgi:catechol 2,3-dioxygenase-like lactoylglutathione lyase family enzyme